MMDNLEARLAALVDHLAELLARQEAMLAVSASQGEAALVNDVAALEARTVSLAALIQENAEAEKTRLALLKHIVAELKLPVEQQTLSGLIEAAPAPWSRRLAEYQERLRDVLQQTRVQVRENHVRLRRSMKVVGDAIGMLADNLPQGPKPYTQLGETAMAGSAPALLDRKG